MGNRSKKPVPNTKQAASSSLVAASLSAHYSGPIPPASEMVKYEEVCPGMANRIMELAENQSKHRQKLESQVVRTACIVNILGVICALIIALASLWVCWLCIREGHTALGSSIGVLGIGGIVSAFIYGTRSNRQEREKKWEKIQEARSRYNV